MPDQFGWDNNFGNNPAPNTYRCWISGQKDQTLEVIRAASSFAARQQIARKYRLAVTDAVSQRIN